MSQGAHGAHMRLFVTALFIMCSLHPSLGESKTGKGTIIRTGWYVLLPSEVPVTTPVLVAGKPLPPCDVGLPEDLAKGAVIYFVRTEGRLEVNSQPWDAFAVSSSRVGAVRAESSGREIYAHLSIRRGRLSGSFTVLENGDKKCGSSWQFSVSYSAKAP
jgi:hypothetical protein